MRLHRDIASHSIRAIAMCGVQVALLIVLTTNEAWAQTWQYIAPMKYPRSRPRAALLSNGKILVAGGTDGKQALSSCEIYDPSTNTWVEGGSLNIGRWNFQLMPLYDGRWLAAGGQIDVGVATTATCEIYDPLTDTWSMTTPMNDRREQFEAVAIPGNKILLIGGLDGDHASYPTSCDLYDEKTQSISVFPPLLIHTAAAAAFYLPDDSSILVPGGYFDGFDGYKLFSTQIYSFNTNRWSLGDSLLESQGNHYNEVQQRGTNRVFILAGDLITEGTKLTGTVEYYDPTERTWARSGSVTPAFQDRALFVSDDSILDIAGQDSLYHPISDCWWYDCRTLSTGHAPSLPERRVEGAPLLDKSTGTLDPCAIPRTVYLLGGLDSAGNALKTCLALSLGRSSSVLALSGVMQMQKSSCGVLDTVISIGIIDCLPASASLDSLWLTGSPAFSISDTRVVPRSLGTLDSILISYSGSRGPDTALLHLHFDFGSGVQDTEVQLIGTLASPYLSQVAPLHREAASAYYGDLDSLPLGVDLNSQINLDSLWPYITDIQATYSWDSSVVSYASYLPPAGWLLNSIVPRGNAVDFIIQNASSTATDPLDLGMALFRPRSRQLATSWVQLPRFVIDVGTEPLSLCVTDNEDSHWSVKTLGTLSVASSLSPTGDGISIYPNPAEDKLFVKNSNGLSASVTIYDAIGRTVARSNIAPNFSVTLNFESAPAGSYSAVCHIGDRVSISRFIKIQ